MKKVIFIFFVFITSFITSCRNDKEGIKKDIENNSINDSISDESKTIEPAMLEGTYKGIVPCVEKSCKEIEIKIKLLPNNGYLYSTKRPGIDNEALTTTGVFEFDKNRNTIVLPEIADAPNTFLVENGKITRLDRNKNKIMTADSAKYIFSKQQ